MRLQFLKLSFCLLAFIILAPASLLAKELIRSVSVSSDHFNPTAGQRLTISVDVSQPGKLIVQIVDRDGYLVKTLAKEQQVAIGKHQFEWLGNTDADSSEIVSDEAYSFRIQLSTGGKVETYFPANQLSRELKPKLNYYDRKRGIVSFLLERGGRVHLQAGVARVLDEKKKSVEGCVMKTITNRSPRGAGSIAEFWDGFADGDKSIYVPDLPNFKIAIAATELPENSVITVGGRGKSFAESVVNRKGESLFTFKPSSHHHHQGLTTLEDISPDLAIHFENATWNESERMWITQDSNLKLTGTLQGPNAEAFSKQPGRLLVFLGEKRVIDVPKPLSTSFDLNVPLNHVSSGIHILTLNSVSLNGPVGVHAVRFRVNANPHSAKSKVQGKEK